MEISEQKPAKNKSRVKTFTRKDLENKISDKLIGKKLTEKIIADSFFNSLSELLFEADPVIRIEIRDFGVFEVKKTKAKPKARNIKTGEFVFVPERRKIHFKPGKNIKQFLKKKINS
ncbi:MAG TPA: HU family DNA-binding protein [Ignavibacteria bacterium]|nr:HU family DNA-binding protein [Ignavibacteria bacterium]